jgi:hypothetical protein
MAEGFGCIILKGGEAKFVEPDYEGYISHETIIRRLGLKDEDAENRSFLRVEFEDWLSKNFHLDECPDYLPSWSQEIDIPNITKKLMRKIRVIRKKNLPRKEMVEELSHIEGYVPPPPIPEGSFSAVVKHITTHLHSMEGGHSDSPNHGMTLCSGDRLTFRPAPWRGWYKDENYELNWHRTWLEGFDPEPPTISPE